MYQQRLEEVNQWFATVIQQLPDQQKQVLVDALDQLVIYLTNYYQKKSRLDEVEAKILLEGRLHDEDVASIEQMDRLTEPQLEHIAHKFATKYSWLSLVQGGVAGIGHPLALAADFPALLTLNLKMLHYISGTYGYSLRQPAEQVILLQVLHAACLQQPHRDQLKGWLLEQTSTEEYWPLRANQTIIQPEWLECLAKQWIKSLFLYGLKKSSKKGFSWLGIAIGAQMNYQFSKQIGQYSIDFYHRRRFGAVEQGVEYES